MLTNSVSPQLTIIKNISTSNAIVGNVVTYTLKVSNVGNVNLFDISISDPLSSNLKFINGSVKINDTSSPQDSILSGVSLDPLTPGSTAIVSFDAKILSQPESKQIVNAALGEYSYIDSDISATKYGSTTSNEQSLEINNVNLDIFKKGDKNSVSIGDFVNYTITISNTGDINLINIIFTDKIPKGLGIVNGTFTINGSILNSVDLNTGVIIPNLKINTSAIITYQVKVISTKGCDAINEAKAQYRYVLPDGSSSIGETKSTPNSIYILKTNVSNFKQISIEEYLEVPTQKPNIEGIINVSAKANLLRSSIVKTEPSMSIEGQKLTNYKLIVQGILHLLIEYTTYGLEDHVHSAHFNIPFSTFLVLPIDFIPGYRIEPSCTIEDVYAKNINSKRIFTSTILLVTARVQSC